MSEQLEIESPRDTWQPASPFALRAPGPGISLEERVAALENAEVRTATVVRGGGYREPSRECLWIGFECHLGGEGAGIQVALVFDPATHMVDVERTAGGIVRGTASFTSPATSHQWAGRVPDPRTGRAPTPFRKYLGIRGLIELSPVHAVVRHLLWAGRYERDHDKRVSQLAGRLWDTMWATLLPHLDPRAIAITDRYGLPWDRYQTFREDPRRMDLADQLPGLGWRIHRNTPTGLPLRHAASKLLGYFRLDGSPFGDNPAFLAWARHVPYDSDAVPFPVRAEDRNGISQKAWDFVMHLARMTEAGGLDVNGIRKLSTKGEWLFFNMAVDLNMGDVAASILRDPAAAYRAAMRYAPPAAMISERAALKRVLQEVRDWQRGAPEAADGVVGFVRMCERSKAWHREIRAKKDAEAEGWQQESHEPFPHTPPMSEAASDGLRLEWLSTPALLMRESRRLGHCVGYAYVGLARAGKCFIYGVCEEESGRPVGTIEVSPDGRIVQAEGEHGRRLPRRALTVARALIRRAWHGEALEQERAKKKSGVRRM